jgi:hypothetical protein
MVSTLPILLALSAVFFPHEKLRRFEWGVLLLSTLGAALISLSKTSEGPQPSMRGDLLIVVSMIAAVFLTLLTKRLEEYDPSYVTATMIVAGTVFLVAWTAMFERPRLIFSTRYALHRHREHEPPVGTRRPVPEDAEDQAVHRNLVRTFFPLRTCLPVLAWYGVIGRASRQAETANDLR